MTLLVVTLFVVHLLPATTANQCEQEYSIFGMMLTRHIYKTMKISSPLECHQACKDDKSCQSLNYVFGEGGCELNNRTNNARPEDFVPDSSRYYLTRYKNRVPLGSIPELPAETCKEIKFSEGHAISGKYWFNSIVSGKSVLAQCDMETEDVDECSADVHICGSNANCTNTNGSYHCSCYSGFTKSGKQCVDIDECADGVHSCLGGTATCTNTIGSYNCSCNHGYVGDGRTSCYIQSAECQNPASLTDANRKETYTGVLLCDSSLGPNWFRFQGAAGNKMATTCVPTSRCGTHATGWLNGAHPTVSEGIVTRQVCFHWSGGCCNWSINIQVRNCSGYFVYYISGTPPVHPCHLRYCGAD